MVTETHTEKENVWFNRFLSLGVLVTCFLGMALSAGAASGMSVMVVEFLEYFHQSRFITSWCSSINFTLDLATAPLWMLVLQQKSMRFVIFVGVIASTAGLFASSFTTNVYQLYISFGLITGLGYGALNYVTIVYASEYFTNRRNLAVGIVSAGSGLGSMIVPLILDASIEAYTWRGALVVLAAITFELAVFAFFVRKINEKDETMNKNDIGEVGRRYRKEDTDTADFHENIMDTVVGGSAMCSEHSDTLYTKPCADVTHNVVQDYNISTIYSADDKHIDSCLNDIKQSTLVIQVDSLKMRTPMENLTFLFKSWQFYLFGLTLLLSVFCSALFFTFNMDYFLSVGIKRSSAIILVLLVGIGNMCGRVFTGIMAQYFKKRQSTFILASDFLIFVSMLLFSKYTDFRLYAVLSFAVGLSYGCISASTPIIIVELFGVARVREGLAVALLAYGLGVLIGPPVGGLVYDLTQDYQVVFTMCMGVSLVAGATIFPVICMSLPCTI